MINNAISAYGKTQGVFETSNTAKNSTDVLPKDSVEISLKEEALDFLKDIPRFFTGYLNSALGVIPGIITGAVAGSLNGVENGINFAIDETKKKSPLGDDGLTKDFPQALLYGLTMAVGGMFGGIGGTMTGAILGGNMAVASCFGDGYNYKFDLAEGFRAGNIGGTMGGSIKGIMDFPEVARQVVFDKIKV